MLTLTACCQRNAHTGEISASDCPVYKVIRGRSAKNLCICGNVKWILSTGTLNIHPISGK